MKTYKSITMALTALFAVIGLASCSSDDYQMVGKPDNAQVYFSSDMATEFNINEGQNSVDVEVRRVKTEGALTVNIESSDEAGLFTIPSSVSFADGENVAKLTISFDFASLKNNTVYPVSLRLKDETTIYGSDSTTVKIMFSPWTEWEPLGWKYPEGITTYEQWDAAFAEYAAGGYADTKIICNGTLPIYTYSSLGFGSYYQPVHYRESLDDSSKAQLLLRGWYNECDLVVNWDRNTNIFTCDKTWTGDTHPTYGPISVMDSYRYWKDVAGQDVTYDYFPQGYDTTKGQITVNMAYFVADGCIGYGPEVIQLPGYVIGDYTITITDVASYANDNQYGQVFMLALGEDIAKVKYAVLDGTLQEKDANVAAQGIVSGSLASTETAEGGHKAVSLPREGKYTLVAVGFDSEGNSTGYYYLQFTCKAAAAVTWKAINTGDYYYALFFGTAEENQVDEGVTLYVANEDPTKFKIAPWAYSDRGFTFTMDGEGNIVVDDQATGFYDTQYGMVYVGDASNYPELGITDKSYFEDGMYCFSLVYYVSAGYMSDAVGYEAFEVTGPAKEAAERAMSVARAKAAAERGLQPKEIKNVTKFPTSTIKNHLYNIRYNFNGFVTLK